MNANLAGERLFVMGARVLALETFEGLYPQTLWHKLLRCILGYPFQGVCADDVGVPLLLRYLSPKLQPLPGFHSEDSCGSLCRHHLLIAEDCWSLVMKWIIPERVKYLCNSLKRFVLRMYLELVKLCLRMFPCAGTWPSWPMGCWSTWWRHAICSRQIACSHSISQAKRCY